MKNLTLKQDQTETEILVNMTRSQEVKEGGK